METIKWAVNEMPKTDDSQLQVMSLENVAKARAFHESFPQYSVTPLVKLDHMAAYLGLKEVYVKDESYRFGLNAFKVLGGSFAMARYIAKQTGKDVSELPYNVLTSDELRKEFGQATFFTATDGNHGRGVAWAANKLGQKSVVLMPKGSTQTRLNNILKEGAKATIEEENYDECVRMANAMAEKTENGVMVQDTAWDGYEEIPAWIMQGYGTMANEADDQLQLAALGFIDVVRANLGLGADDDCVKLTQGRAQLFGSIELLDDLVACLAQLRHGGLVHSISYENTHDKISLYLFCEIRRDRICRAL